MAKSALVNCPHCGGENPLEIPSGKCLPFALCSHCKKLIKAAPPSCCVICSYSNEKCPTSSIK